MSRKGLSTSDMQARAWAYYGWPGSECRAVGEVRYVVGWHADQMTRLDWDVLIDGSDDWSVETGDGTITSRRGTDDDGEVVIDLTEASTELLDLIDWNDSNVRAIDTNLFVAGEGTYAQITENDDWQVVSCIDKDRKVKVEKAVEAVPFIWPHPADPSKPDAPLFSVLELLDELDWLNRQGRTQSRQRALMNGIVVTADGFAGPNDTDFWDEYNNALSARMRDADDLSPIRLKGPAELVKDGVNWIVPPFGYDDVLDRRVLSAIHRLAYGLPVPPEILLGMQAQSRATAFQVEENAYRAHIEPPALLIAQVAQDTLSLLLDRDVTVVPNPARLLARKNSVQDVKDAYDRGLVTTSYVREVLGIPEDAAPLDDLDGVPPASIVPAGSDPANAAAAEGSPINAALRDNADLSQLLADIDAALASELAGVTVMATERARQRLGSAARRNSETVRRDSSMKRLTGAQLAHRLGVEGLDAAGVDVAEQIAEPIDSASRWWARRVEQAWAQVAQIVPGWEGQPGWIDASAAQLVTELTSHIVNTLTQSEPSPLTADGLRSVLDISAGSQAA